MSKIFLYRFFNRLVVAQDEAEAAQLLTADLIYASDDDADPKNLDDWVAQRENCGFVPVDGALEYLHRVPSDETIELSWAFWADREVRWEVPVWLAESNGWCVISMDAAEWCDVIHRYSASPVVKVTDDP